MCLPPSRQRCGYPNHLNDVSKTLSGISHRAAAARIHDTIAGRRSRHSGRLQWESAPPSLISFQPRHALQPDFDLSPVCRSTEMTNCPSYHNISQHGLLNLAYKDKHYSLKLTVDF
jgi:hypothetical protein